MRKGRRREGKGKRKGKGREDAQLRAHDYQLEGKERSVIRKTMIKKRKAIEERERERERERDR